MKMLHVAGEIHPYTMGGIGVHVHDLCKDLSKLGHRIMVFTCLPKHNINLAVPYDVTDFHRTITISGNIICINMFPSLFKNRHKYDVIHAHSHLFFSTVLCAIVRKIGSSPLIITNHGWHSQTAPRWMQKIYLPTIAKWTLNASDKVLCYTLSAKQELIDAGIRKELIHIIPLGIDTEFFHPHAKNSDPKIFTILWAARLVPIKGLKYMVLAYEEFRKIVPNSELIILGTGQYYKPLLKHIAENNLGDCIHALGSIEYQQLPQTYSNADVFCMTSSYEAGPKTIFEAMACGCPVISNNLDHLKEIIPHGGYIISTRDTKAFLDQLLYIYNNQEEAKALGVAGHEYILKNHSWNSYVKNIIEISEEVIMDNIR